METVVSIAYVLIQYRLSRRVLGEKYAVTLTFLVMLGVSLLAGWLNVTLIIATTKEENSLYYALCCLSLYLLLFKGSVLKKVFLTVLIACGMPIPFYILLPVVHYFFEGGTESFFVALNVVQYFNLLAAAAGMEYAGKKFLNLRRELPGGYTIYLTVVILFIYVAVVSAYDRMMMVNHFKLTLFEASTAVMIALAGTAIVWVAIFEIDRQVTRSLKEQLNAVQTDNFKARELEWRRFSGFRHDIKNHLICLSGLLENGKTKQAAAYMRNLTDTVKQFESPVQTDDDYADAILNVKYAEAAAAKIRITIDMAIPSAGFLDPVDLCCILSNAFDNAIAACNRLPEGERWITARGFVRQGQLVLVIKNSKPSYVAVVNGEVSPKEITADHGLGLDTVKSVVGKYGGVLDLAAADAFSFSVMLPRLRS